IGGPITNNGTLNVDVGTTASKILQLTASSQVPGVDGNLVTNVNAVKLRTRDISAAAPAGGQVLGWNSGNSKWEPISKSGGTVLNVNSGTGLTGGPITNNGTLNVDVGTGANKIIQLDASSRLPAVDGGLLTNVNAAKIKGTAISVTAPTANQVLT